MKDRFERVWTQSGWVLLACLGVVSILVGLASFLSHDPRFIKEPSDYRWAIVFGVLFFALIPLVFVDQGRWLLGLAFCFAAFLVWVPMLLSPVGLPVLVVAWMTFAAFLLGDALFSRLDLGSSLPALDRTVLALTAGFAVLMLFSTALGFAKLYYPGVIYALLIAPLIMFLPRKVRSFIRDKNLLGRLFDSPPGVHPLLAWAAAAALISGMGAFMWALAPAVRWDALSYHIPVPLHFIQSHAIAELPETMQSYWAHYAESLSVIGLSIVPSPALPGILHYEMGVLAALLTFILGRKIGGTTQGALAALIYWSLPMIQVEAGSANIELFIVVFVLGVIYQCMLWFESSQNRWLVLAGAFAGIAVGIKISAIFPVGLIGLAVLLFGKLNPHLKGNLFEKILCFGLPAILISAPWFIRDWVWTGNPVFPTYNQIFHSPKVIDRPYFEFLPTGLKLVRLYRMPYDLLFHSQIYYHDMPGFAMGGLSLFSLPWLYPWFSDLRRRPLLVALAGFVGANIVLFTQSSPNFRYLLSITPILSILAAENILLAWRGLGTPTMRRIALGTGLALASAYLLCTQLALVDYRFQIPERYPYRYLLGLETGDHFLKRAIFNYDAYQFIERTADKPIKILSLGSDFRLYTSAQVYDPLFSIDAWDIFKKSPTMEEFASRLQGAGFTHLLVYQPEVELRPYFYRSPVLDNQFLFRYARPVYALDGIRIYQLAFNPPLDTIGPSNLLANPGFEALTAFDFPESWQIAGEPQISIDGTESRNGRVAVHITGPSINGVFQDVSIQAGQLYTLGYWAKPDSEGQVLQLFVQWLSPERKVIGQSAEWADLSPGWNNYQTTFTAPTGTYFARFLATTASPGTTWLDDLCLAYARVCPAR